jgi:hypothetical protein
VPTSESIETNSEKGSNVAAAGDDGGMDGKLIVARYLDGKLIVARAEMDGELVVAVMDVTGRSWTSLFAQIDYTAQTTRSLKGDSATRSRATRSMGDSATRSRATRSMGRGGGLDGMGRSGEFDDPVYSFYD